MIFLKKYGVSILFFMLLLGNIFIWYAVLSEERGDVLTVAFLDVGQGDAIFIEAPNGNQMLIDGGGNASVLRALSGVLLFYDRSIDIVMATHPDKDHIGGLPEVFKRFDVDYFIEPGVSAETGAYRELTALVAREYGIENLVARRGMKIFLDEDVVFCILFPDRDMEGADANDASIVGKLVYGDASFLFTGDAPEKIENFIVSLDGTALDADVLKVGHHGSKTSSGELFLGFISPRYSVISSGKENRYGHPHTEVFERLKEFKSVILRTDELGTIIFKTDGRGVVFEG